MPSTSRVATDAAVVLTERELSVLRLMAAGHSNKEIARSLDLATGRAEAWTRATTPAGLDLSQMPEQQVVRWSTFDGRTISGVLSLPPDTQLHMCHDYQPGGRALQYVSTVADERARNVHVRNGISEEAFVAMRTARDATLSPPRLLFPSVQVNVDAGRLPAPHANGNRYLVIPLNVLRPASELGEPLPRKGA